MGVHVGITKYVLMKETSDIWLITEVLDYTTRLEDELKVRIEFLYDSWLHPFHFIRSMYYLSYRQL